MPLTIGRSRRSGFAKTVVKIPRKQVAGQPGLEPVDAPLTPLEKKVARIFVEALTFTPRQISRLLEEDETVGALTPFLEHLEPARKELSDALMEQLDESGAFFWNELVDQLKRKPDPSSVNFIAKNQIRKEIDPEDVTVVMPTGAEFTSSFSKRTPRGKRWADNESARLITNIAEETRENLQDVIASATGRGGRQRMMTLLGNVLENAPAGIDSGNVLTKFQSEVSPAVAGLTFKQHNAVINTANKAFDDALAKGLPFNKAVEAAEKEALAHGKRAREYRARMISRTEMMEASNRGKLEAAKQAAEAGMFNPHRAGRQWVTSTFDVCVTCEPLHGKVVAFESGTFPAKYKVSGNWVEEPHDLPPAHPNCRCTWTLVYDTVVPPTATETGVLTPPKDVPLELLNRAWAEAGKLARSVASVQDEVTGVMVSVADDIGADMYGLQHATKTEASLARKITTDFTEEVAKDPTLTVEAVAEDIGDALRFTMIADAENYTDDVMAALRDLEARGYTYKKAPKNFWRVDNLKNPYNGINVNMRTPTGQIVEIQFHTPEGIAMKNRIHPLYERQRAIGVTQELKDEIAEEMAEMVSVLDYPDDVTDLRFFPDEEIKYRLETEDDIVARFGGKWPEGSMDAYTDADGNWWEMRETLHENIIEEGLSKATPVEEPIVHFMGGGPASGKGTAIRQGLIDVPDNIVVVDADEIKDALPEYKALIDDRSSRAAAYVHEESSYLSKEMFQESIDSGRNTQLDGTGDSSIEKLRSKVASAREASSAQGGTRVIADYITIDTEEAVKRARSRAIRTGRSVPESVVRETHASISRIFPDILDENLFDDIKLWDTAFDPPKLILRKVDGVLEIYDEAAYERFLLKNPDYPGAGIKPGIEPIIDSKSRVYLTIDEQYDPLRQSQVHEPFYEEKLAQGVPTDEPDVVILGGGPASGKGHLLDRDIIEKPEGHIVVNPDDAKAVIPEYKQIIENGDSWASTYVHEESSDMAQELMARALVDESIPVILDGTGDSTYEKLTIKVNTARQRAKGGRVRGEYVTSDIDVAIERAAIRAKREGRDVPEGVIRETHVNVSKVFPKAADDDLFDELRLYDTNSGEPVLIYEKIDGVENIIDPEAYERFLMKNPDYTPPASETIESLRSITETLSNMEDDLGISLLVDDAGNYAGTPAYYADDVPVRVETGTSYADEVEVVGSFKEQKETLDVALEMVDSAFAPPTGGLSLYWDRRPKKVEFRYTPTKPKGKDGLGGSYNKKKYPDRPKRVAKPARIKKMIPEVTSNLDEWAKQRSYALGEPIAALDVATGLPATVNGKIAYVHDNMAEQAKQYRHVATRLEELNKRAMQDSALFELYGYESAEEMLEEYYSYWYAQAERLEEIDVYDRGYIGESFRFIRLRPGTKGSRTNALVHEIGHDFDYMQEIELVLIKNKEKMQLSPNDSNIEIIFDLYKRGKINKASVGEQGLAYIEFMENVVESKAYKKLLSQEVQDTMLNAGMSQAEISAYLQYATSPKEVWARAFNQWTTTRHGRNAPDAVEDMLVESLPSFNNIGFQWEQEDFDIMVAPYLEKIFKANGWVE
tara:strand:- start:816 stop:5537 length:4722 start_codon:yes stop_codon:yes gene_type:complete